MGYSPANAFQLLLVSVALSGFALTSAAAASGQAMLAAVQGQTGPAATQPAAARPFCLEDGTPIKLRIQRTVSSASAQVDERVDFDVLEEIKVNDVVVIPKGSVAWGTVTEAQPKRRMGRGGKLAVNIDAVRLADGEKAPLRAVKDVKGGGHTGAMTGAMVATGIMFFPAAPLFLFMHGKDITFPKGTEITAYITGDLNLDPAKFGAKPSTETPASAPAAQPPTQPATPAATQPVAAPPTPTPAPAAVPPEELSTVVVKSTPDGADITVDGKFVGSTPSTLPLAPGVHIIVIEKSGFKAWQRAMNVSPGGNVTIDATLENNP